MDKTFCMRVALALSCLVCMTVGAAEPATGAKRTWTVPDIVEVSEITSLAVSDDGRRVAYTVKQPKLRTGELRYELYVLDRVAGMAATRILEGTFVGDVSAHPGTSLWTVRADLGQGVQLYDIDEHGTSTPFVVNPTPAQTGGGAGLVRRAWQEPQNTGVIAYGWSPDGAHFWYSQMRVNDAGRRQALNDAGIVYDDVRRSALEFVTDMSALAGLELHLRSADGKVDRVASFAPSESLGNLSRFTRSDVSWARDSQSLQYSFDTVRPSGAREFSRWRLDVRTGEAERMPADSQDWSARALAVPTPDGRGFIFVSEEGANHRLKRADAKGATVGDFGEVSFTRIGMGLGVWWDGEGRRAVLGVHYRDRDGLTMIPVGRASARLAAIPDALSDCDFVRDLTIGVCVRQSLTLAPEVVEVNGLTGKLRTLARPNARYDAIEPLRSERRQWTNRFGAVSDGYVTYPRGFEKGKKYPVIVVTHGGDAQNRFLYEGFQWSFPVQVWAERGYLVLSVNDPIADPRTRASRDAFVTGGAGVGVAEMQFYKNESPLAGLEAAVQSVVDAGIADPEHVGIAGYSRGCEMVEFALAHSKVFKAGIDGDAGGWNPGGYWALGTAMYPALYRGMYGGSMYDPKNYENYQRYSPAFRAREFAGPLLQQFAQVSGTLGLELHVLLREAGVPTELVTYADETHLFWHPRHRESAMIRSLDWFDYWLLGKRRADAQDADQFKRWDAMAARWNTNSGSASQ